MRVVIQRVLKASVLINATEKRVISQGLVVLLGIEMSDTEEDVLWLVNKTLNLRIFGDENDVMNRSLLDIPTARSRSYRCCRSSPRCGESPRQ